jgi:hypothetical protein
MYRKRILGVVLLILMGLVTTKAQNTVQVKYKLVRNDTGDHLIVSGETSFPAQSVAITGTAKTTGNNNVTIPTIPASLNPLVTPGTAIVRAVTFSSTVDYGTGKALTPDMTQLTLNITADAVPVPPATSASPVATTVYVDMQFVNEHFSKLTELDRVSRELETALRDRPTPSAAPIISLGGATVLDRTILVRVNSNTAVKVKASAILRGSNPQVVASESSEAEIPSGGQVQLRLANLNPNTNYDIVIREVSNVVGRQTVQLMVVSNPLDGSPLRTLNLIPNPTVTFVPGVPYKVINNRQIKIPISATNASRVRLTLEAQDINGVWTPIEGPITTTITANAGEAPFTVFPLRQTVLNPQVTYRVKVEGLSQFDDADPGVSILTTTFSGLSPLLAQAVDFEFVQDGIKFTANTNNVPAKLEVKVGTAPQTFSYATSAASGNPSFTLPFAALQAGMGAAPNENDLRLPLVIGIRADDGSEREHTLAVALKINRGELTSKPSNAKQRIGEFVQDLRSTNTFQPGQGKSMKMGDIFRTGLSVLLRFLLPVP